MLVLNVSKNQKIQIGDNVFIRIYTDPKDNGLKIAIDAPRSINIKRIKEEYSVQPFEQKNKP